MASDRATVDLILQRLGSPRFSSQSMMGEFVLYADGKVVGIVADNKFFVKIHPATASLEAHCEQASAYPGSKPYYLVEERQWKAVPNLPQVLLQLADALPAPPAPGPQASASEPTASKGAAKAKALRRKRA